MALTIFSEFKNTKLKPPIPAVLFIWMRHRQPAAAGSCRFAAQQCLCHGLVLVLMDDDSEASGFFFHVFSSGKLELGVQGMGNMADAASQMLLTMQDAQSETDRIIEIDLPPRYLSLYLVLPTSADAKNYAGFMSEMVNIALRDAQQLT